MIIDAHTHGFYGKYTDRLISAGGEWAKKSIERLLSNMRNKPQFADPAARVQQLERCGIDFQLVTPQHQVDSNLLPGDISAQMNFAIATNDQMARMFDDSRGKLLGACSVPLTKFEKYGVKEMDRAIKTLGLKAVSIPSNLNGKPIDLPEYDGFWAKAAAMAIPVFIHPNDAAGHADRSYEVDYDMMHNFGWPFETELILSRLVFSGIMERHPSLKVVSHHLGGGIPFWWGRINETYNLNAQQRLLGRVLPKPLFDYFSLFYYDTAVGGNASAIRCAYEIFGADKIIFATDAPWGPGTGEGRLIEYPKAVKSLKLSDEENNKIFFENARKVLNLK